MNKTNATTPSPNRSQQGNCPTAPWALEVIVCRWLVPLQQWQSCGQFHPVPLRLQSRQSRQSIQSSFCKSVYRSQGCKRASRRGKKQGADFPDISTDQNPIKTLNSLHGSARLVVTKHWWFALKFERHIKLKGMSLPKKKRDTCLSNLNGNMKH